MYLGRTRALAAAAIAVVGCDVPTEVPILEHSWELPVEGSTISVDEFLPAGVSVNGGSFVVSVDPVTTDRGLGSLCGACALLHGRTSPVPPFAGEFGTTAELPADVFGAILVSGSVRLAIRNGFSFDPLEGGGRVVITLSDGSGGRQLAELEVGGALGDRLPPGGTLTRDVDLAPGDIGTTITSTAMIAVLGGALVRVDTAQEISVTVTPASILVGSAQVDVAEQAVVLETVDLDVEDVDSDVAERVQEGAVILDITNPFGVSAAGQIEVHYLGGVITKSLTVDGAASSRVSVAFSGGELRAFLGTSPVTLTGSARVSAGAGVITVSPGQILGIDARIQLRLTIGG